MSKIQTELSKATDVEPKRGEDRQDFLSRLVKAISGLSDKAWDALSLEAQDWFNAYAKDRNEAKKADKDVPAIPDFPDAEEEKEAPRGRSRASDDDKKDEPRAMKKGDNVKITTKRGKVYEGKVVELDKEVVVIKGKDGEDEIDLDRIESSEVFHGTAGKNDEPADPIRVGVTVKLVTKRGKEVTGEITELTDDDIVLKTSEGPEDFSRSRVESITPIGGKSGAKDDDQPRRSRASDDDKKDDDKKRSSNAAGVSVGTRIKELIADDMEATEDDIAKALKKEGIEFKENTLSLNYKDARKFLDILKEKGLLAKKR